MLRPEDNQEKLLFSFKWNRYKNNSILKYIELTFICPAEKKKFSTRETTNPQADTYVQTHREESTRTNSYYYVNIPIEIYIIMHTIHKTHRNKSHI